MSRSALSYISHNLPVDRDAKYDSSSVIVLSGAWSGLIEEFFIHCVGVEKNLWRLSRSRVSVLERGQQRLRETCLGC